MYLQHVNVYVRNVERSKKWYEDLLGLHVYEYRPGWAAFLTADEEQSHEVALMQLGEDAPLQSKRQVGLNHMAWRLESLDDLKEFYRRSRPRDSR
jgi:catechol 2,3-dioxygenase